MQKCSLLANRKSIESIYCLPSQRSESTQHNAVIFSDFYFASFAVGRRRARAADPQTEKE